VLGVNQAMSTESGRVAKPHGPFSNRLYDLGSTSLATGSIEPSVSPPLGANPQGDGAGPAMQAVRPVKPLKLRLNGRH
jgi:hypothetical protein